MVRRNDEDLAEYIYSKYPNIRKKYSFRYILNKIKSGQNNYIYIQENGKLNGIAGFLKLEDNSLNNIRVGKLDLEKKEDFNKVRYEDGDNIHFYLLAADGVKTILKGIKKIILMYQPNTISWNNRNNKFRIIILGDKNGRI